MEQIEFHSALTTQNTPSSGLDSENPDTATINLMPLTFDLVSLSSLKTSDLLKHRPVSLYCWARANEIAGDTPLIDLLGISREIDEIIGFIVASDFRVKWGRYGSGMDFQLARDLSDFLKSEIPGLSLQQSANRQSFVGFGLGKVLKIFRERYRDRNYFRPIVDENLSNKKVIEAGLSEVRNRPDLVIFPTNGDAGYLVTITQLLLRLAHRYRPRQVRGKAPGKVLENEYLLRPTVEEGVCGIMRECYLFAEIGLPKPLLLEMAKVMADVSLDFLPFALLYQLAAGKHAGGDFALNLNHWAALLGYHSSNSVLYVTDAISRKREDPRFQDELYQGFPFRIDQIYAEQEAHPTEPFAIRLEGDRDLDCYRVHPKEGKGKGLTAWKAFVGPDGAPHFGYSIGRFVVDSSRLPVDQPVLMREQKNDALPMPKASYQYQDGSQFTCDFLGEDQVITHPNFRHSIFTSLEERQRAYKVHVHENYVSKPKLPISIHQHDFWSPRFDEYVRRGFNLDGLGPILVENLNKKYAKKKKKDTDPEGGDDSAGKRLIQDYTLPMVEKALDILRGKVLPEDYGFSAAIVSQKAVRGKARDTVRSTNRQKFNDRVFLELAQAALANICRQFLGFRLTNSMPNISPAMATGKALTEAIAKSRHHFKVMKLDISSCYPSLDVRNPEFLNQLERSRDRLIGLGFVPEANILWKILKEYQFDGLLNGHFIIGYRNRNKPSKAFTRYSIQTGFSLSASMLYFLVLPLCIELETFRREGKILEWLLCSDDLIVFAPGDISADDRRAVVAGWLDLSRRMNLSLHFWKDERNPDPRKRKTVIPEGLRNELLEPLDSEATPEVHAWCKIPWPSHVTLIHAGVVIKGLRHNSVNRTYSPKPGDNIDRIREKNEKTLGADRYNSRIMSGMGLWSPEYLVRRWQFPELSKGELIEKMFNPGHPFDREDVDQGIESELILDTDLVPIGRVSQDKDRPFQPPRFKKIVDTYDIGQRRFSLPFRHPLGSQIEGIPTGNYFLGSQISPEAVAALPEPSRTQYKPKPAAKARSRIRAEAVACDDLSKAQKKMETLIRYDGSLEESRCTSEYIRSKVEQNSRKWGLTSVLLTEISGLPMQMTFQKVPLKTLRHAYGKEQLADLLNRFDMVCIYQGIFGSNFQASLKGKRVRVTTVSTAELNDSIAKRQNALTEAATREGRKIEARRKKLTGGQYKEKLEAHIASRSWKRIPSALLGWFENQLDVKMSPNDVQALKNLKIRANLNLQEELLLYREHLGHVVSEIRAGRELWTDEYGTEWSKDSSLVDHEALRGLFYFDENKVHHRTRQAYLIARGKGPLFRHVDSKSKVVYPNSRKFEEINKFLKKGFRPGTDPNGKACMVKDPPRLAPPEAHNPTRQMVPIALYFLKGGCKLSPLAIEILRDMREGVLCLPAVYGRKYKISRTGRGGLKPFYVGYFRHVWPSDLLRGWGSKLFGEFESTQFDERALELLTDEEKQWLIEACDEQVTLLMQGKRLTKIRRHAESRGKGYPCFPDDYIESVVECFEQAKGEALELKAFIGASVLLGIDHPPPALDEGLAGT